ncbi:uncharacterized protein LOC119018606 isoform X2 [Acanthopagrus latus]|uniref:uncharacterized protein LOC119018606 isoform X2 n=1 Tax=Acanthopagrus latus TaxID=8177 RepID=UPI00187C305E|nr:uncharacterized protein LOC119018606 isoform X2 [Acanthopagrus latus]
MPGMFSVPGCKGYRKARSRGVVFHSLPTRDPGRCRKWLKAIQNPKFDENTPVIKYGNIRVCSQHFKPEDYEPDIQAELMKTTPRKILKSHVIPSVFSGRQQEDLDTSLPADDSSRTEAKASSTAAQASSSAVSCSSIDSVLERHSVLTSCPTTSSQFAPGGVQVADVDSVCPCPSLPIANDTGAPSTSSQFPPPAELSKGPLKNIKAYSKRREKGVLSSWSSYEMKSSISLTSTGTCMHEPPARSSPEHVSASARGKQGDVDHQSDTTLEASEVNYPRDSDEMDVAIDEDSMKNRLSDLDSDVEKVAETSELSGLGADDSCDEEVYVPTIPQRHLSTKSELLLECEEEELEPWQKQTSHARLKEGDDSGELSKDQADCSPEPSLLQRNTSFIGTSPRQQLTSNAELIGSLGTKCRAGNSFTVLPASKKRRFRNVATTTVKQEACDEIIDNQESLSGVRSPAVCGATSYNQLLPDQPNSQTSPVNLSLPCFAEHEHKLTAASSKR